MYFLFQYLYLPPIVCPFFLKLNGLEFNCKVLAIFNHGLIKNSIDMRKYVILLFIVSFSTLYGQKIKSPRDQAVWIDSMLAYRFERMVPAMMERTGIDMWVLISREYNEDPILMTMLPSSWISARRRTILVFNRDINTGLVEKVAIARYDFGKLMKGEWNIDVYSDQYEALVDYIKKKNPNKIGLNYSNDFGLADGLIHTEYELFKSKLDKVYHDKLVSAEKLALAWLETRSPMEMDFYKELLDIGHGILDHIFSRKYIVPGKTTTEDVVWALRKRARDLGLTVWFHPTVSLQRDDADKFDHLRSFSKRPEKEIIQEGDLLHVDFGITYMRLNTDQQQHFYVIRKSEKKVPGFLNKAFSKANRVQDILTSNFKSGASGNELLANTLKKAKEEGIDATVYTHPIGFHGHAAGPTIGLWDQQGGVKGSGDYSVFPNTAYSIELNAASTIPEWKGKVIKIMLEEDGIFDGDKFYWPAGRQLEIKGI